MIRHPSGRVCRKINENPDPFEARPGVSGGRRICREKARKKAISGLAFLNMDSTLTEKINQLRLAIAEIDGLPTTQRDQILKSLDEIDTAAPAGEQDHFPLIGQLEESLIEVEAKHPDAAQLLRGLSDALGRMGL